MSYLASSDHNKKQVQYTAIRTRTSTTTGTIKLPNIELNARTNKKKKRNITRQNLKTESHHTAKTINTAGATCVIVQHRRPSFTNIATGGGAGTWRTPHQTHRRGAYERPFHYKENKPPPINITLQYSKDTVTLIEKVANIKQFHIKRIHSGKHALYLRNLPDFHKAKETLLAANTTFYTYTPKTEKHHTYLLKGLDNSYTETEILTDL